MYKSIILIGLVTVLAGCATPRQMALLEGDASSTTKADIPAFTIADGDELQIVFSAQNAEAIAPFNSSGTQFIVDADGKVTLPVIGNVSLAGKTIRQAQDTLQQLVCRQVHNAIVQVSITNAVITVLGEVHHPMCISIKQAMPFLQAIGQAGGFTRNAKCKSIMVQRQQGEQIQQYRINLLTKELYTSPCYYLQKGDVVYVSPLHPAKVH